jgi:hypothetical protein
MGARYQKRARVMPGQVEAERRQSIDLDLLCDQQIGGGLRTVTFVDSHPSGMIVYRRRTVMGSTLRKFTPEFKAEAVELLINSGKPIAEIGRDFGISDGTLGNWMKAAKKRGDFEEKPLETTNVHG